MSGLVVDVLGTAVRVLAPEPVLADLRVTLADLAPAPLAARELALVPAGGGFELRDDGRTVRRRVHPSVAVATVAWRLNAIAGECTGHVVIHGACVAGPSGAAVVLPGGTGAGKSTLAAACVAAGLRYLTDELVAIDVRTGRVAPYARPLGLEGPQTADPTSGPPALAGPARPPRLTGGALGERLVPASALGPVAAGPASPAALVFPRYEPGAGLTEAPLDAGWALLALAAHATNLSDLGGPALAWLAGIAAACPAVQLTHGDAGDAVAVVERAAAGPPWPVRAAPVLDPVTAETTAVALGDGLAVLHRPSGRVHLLNASAAAVWRRATGVELPGPAGQPPDPATAATVERLVRTGLLAAAPPT